MKKKDNEEFELLTSVWSIKFLEQKNEFILFMHHLAEKQKSDQRWIARRRHSESCKMSWILQYVKRSK
jgi:hypothetical protein